VVSSADETSLRPHKLPAGKEVYLLFAILFGQEYFCCRHNKNFTTLTRDFVC
jgi:hypothetical protein